MSMQEKIRSLAPMISCSTLDSYGKYDIVETKMEAYTFD